MFVSLGSEWSGELLDEGLISILETGLISVSEMGLERDLIAFYTFHRVNYNSLSTAK